MEAMDRRDVFQNHADSIGLCSGQPFKLNGSQHLLEQILYSILLSHFAVHKRLQVKRLLNVARHFRNRGAYNSRFFWDISA